MAALLLGLACGGGGQPESAAPKPGKEPQIVPLPTAPLAGQPVAVIPLTILITDESFIATAPFDDRARSLAWADSIIGAALLARAPEPKWVMPPELRRVAHRAVGIAPDPDHMGQGVMRSPKLQDVPDPLRSQLRSLLAVAGGRYAFIPAAVGVVRDSAGARVDASLVLADIRLGKVVWRTVAYGRGSTPAGALTAAMAAAFPVGLGE